MAPYEALNGKKYRTPICLNEIGERKLLGLELEKLSTNKVKLIRERIKEAQNRQKSYEDNQRRPFEFEVED